MKKSMKLKNDLTHSGDIMRLAKILSDNGFATHKIATALEYAARYWRNNADILEGQWAKHFDLPISTIKEYVKENKLNDR